MVRTQWCQAGGGVYREHFAAKTSVEAVLQASLKLQQDHKRNAHIRTRGLYREPLPLDAVGQALAQKLHIAAVGHKNIQRAFNDLKYYSGLQQVLWFEFGIKNIVRQLGSSDQGRGCLALCAALSESFDEEFAADVLHALTLAQRAPDHLTPSINEWCMLVQACAGIFATSKFPLLVGHFGRLLRTGNRAQSSTPQPADLASALVTIGKVSCGELASIKIIQRKACSVGGWLAAVSEWLLGLKVAVYGNGQQLLYINCHNPSDAQVQLCCEASAAEASGALMRVEETFLTGYERLVVATDEWKFDTRASGRVA
ncbi:hypothetical protein H2201_003858 [Coniosporium apollinis]|uniref:Uncharacterized protein n=1 Tax=Coniosporium apollinis TaxID=61459 RepID=A0ABQ9P0M2_9PEZI|nr:hypothetical protein H2201_003858 [Coniosporium apollinis]